MSKFQVGEIAIYVGPCFEEFGREVEVVLTGPIRAYERLNVYGGTLTCTQNTDYAVKCKDGKFMFCPERNLRKRPQPGIPQSVLNIFRLPVEA